MKQRVIWILALLCTVAQGVWAQTPVNSEQELNAAITDGATNIQLTADIQLSSYLFIAVNTVTIDLNGHKLYRNLSDYSINGCVISVENGGYLTLTSSKAGGSIAGGRADFGGGIKVLTSCSLTVSDVTFTNNSATDHGGAIFAQIGTNVTLSNTTFTSNSANDHAGAIWNNGTLTATDCTFENNTASDVGAIYNSVTVDGSGTATLTGCTFTGNTGTTGAGALANALGHTVMTIENSTITDNIASGHGGAIWNGGTLTATNSTFTNNIANDVGGIYNAVSTDGTNAGKTTLKGCSFSRNRGYAGAGALANALGATVMNIEDCTIENNTAYQYGAGIWNGGTLNVKGEVKVSGNKNDDDMFSNLYLKTGKVITVTGDITGSNIGVELETVSGKFTNGYITYHGGVDPSNFFSPDRLNVVSLDLDDDGEVCLSVKNPITYIERSWDDTNKEVVSTEKSLKGVMLGYDATPVEGVYKEVTNAPASSPYEWFGMGGYSDDVAEFYVVRGNVNRETVVVQGKNVHLILCDGATLTLTGGLRLEDDHKLYIHCQSYGDDMGRLMVTNEYNNAAGIGSARHNDNTKRVGELVIYGGHIEATGGFGGAGIGSCAKKNEIEESRLCNRVIVYGGYVKATGGYNGAGIGGGYYYPELKGLGIDGGDFILYDGTVIATSGITASHHAGGAAGVGGGGSGKCYGGYGGNVTIYGGTLTAFGNRGAAGIGSAQLDAEDNNKELSCGGTFTIYGGSVTAYGYSGGAGIGGGINSGGAIVSIYGGTVTATGENYGAGIGGGENGWGGNVTITGGTVTATGGYKGAGIGGGIGAEGGNVTITGGTVIVDGGGCAAGIGGSDGGKGGIVTITGGTVTVEGGENAAGIGGGKGGEGGTVTITGGTVIVTNYKLSNRAIGAGAGSNDNGSLTLGDAMMVGAGDNGTVESIFDANERVNACWFHSYAEISPCTHPSGVTYTINGADTHTTHCKHCGVSETVAHFNSDSTDPCICGYKNGESYCTITLATSSNGTSYEGVGITANVGNNKPYTLPVCTDIPDGYDFAGWVVNPQSQENGIRPNEGETLLAAKSEYIVTSSVSIFARYKDIVINLADDSDNAETLYTYNERKATSVTLTGRTLWKDNSWNTLCLPFSLTEEQVNTQLAPNELKTLESSEFAGETLTLTFANATTIEAGKPYIVKWESGSHIVEPTFTDVTVNDSYNPVETDVVDFVGTFSPIDIFTEEKTTLYLGPDNLLYYPSGEDMTSFSINSFRAFFQLKNGLTAGEPLSTDVQGIKSFVLNFGEETGIEEVHGYGLWVNGYGPGWFTLDGRRLEDKPTAKGIYLFEGRKVLIK